MMDIIAGIAGLIIDVIGTLSFPTWLWILLLATGFVLIPNYLINLLKQASVAGPVSIPSSQTGVRELSPKAHQG